MGFPVSVFFHIGVRSGERTDLVSEQGPPFLPGDRSVEGYRQILHSLEIFPFPKLVEGKRTPF